MALSVSMAETDGKVQHHNLTMSDSFLDIDDFVCGTVNNSSRPESMGCGDLLMDLRISRRSLTSRYAQGGGDPHLLQDYPRIMY